MKATFNWLWARARTITFVLLAVQGSMAAAAPLTADDYARRPDIDSVVPSPSGKRLALLLFGPSGQRRLGIMDLDPIGQPRVVAEYGDADVTRVHWVSDDRLVYEAFQQGPEIREGGAGTFAVNHDGTAPRQLISWRYSGTEIPGSRIALRILPYGWFFHSATDDGSNDIFIYKNVSDVRGEPLQIQLARLNTMTGIVQPLSHGMPEGTATWLLDMKNEPRVLTTYKDGRTKVFWRAAPSTPWAEVADFDPLTAGFTPSLVDGDGKILVYTRMEGDTTGLYKFDPVAKRVEPEPVIKVSGFDLSSNLETDSQSGHLVGVHLAADRPVSYWFDPTLQKIQRGIDTVLPDRSNTLLCGRCESTRFLVIRSQSDRLPGEYLLFDRQKSSLQAIGLSRPWITEASQGRRSFHRITTRDGMQMPVYVTSPANAAADAPLPTVVLVHGGPFLRGTNVLWHAEPQFLASQGYRVLEPEFRGSWGYGSKLFRAGWKQWGRAMQDDLADAVQWSVKQKLTDAGKVCIVGGSYGGYAALMAPIATPGVFRCAASFAAVTDIDLMYNILWSDTTEAAKQYSMPQMIGDPVKDADLLSSVSPLKRVAEIKIPLLVAHGGSDRRVPIDHSRKFVAAAKRAGVSVQEVTYLEEGHGFYNPTNQADYYRQLENFLAKSLKDPQ